MHTPHSGAPWRAAPLIACAAGVLLASGLPAALAGSVSTRMAIAAGLATTLVLGGLWRLTCRVGRLAPARRILAVFALLSVFGWFSALVTVLPPVAHWLDTAPVGLAFLLVNGLKLISVAPLALIVRRWRPTDLYLRVGDPRAPVGLPGVARGVRWTVAGPVLIVLVLTLFLTSVPADRMDGLPGALRWLPVFVAAAFVNAAAEEFLYRHAAVAALRDVMTVPAAIALTSVVFGLAHLTGNPGGLTGVLYTGIFGCVCALAMVQVRGFGWNLPLHIAGDVGVLFVLVLAPS